MPTKPIRIGISEGDAVQRLYGGVGRCELLTLGPRIWGAALWHRSARALEEGRVDVVTVPASEVPIRLHCEIRLAGALKRSDARSVLITRRGEPFATLPLESRVAAVGALRKAQMLRIRPDLIIDRADDDPPAAARAVEDGRLDGAIMPGGCCIPPDRRLSPLPVAWFLPSPGQGAVALLTREGDEGADVFVAGVSHRASFLELVAERSFAASLDESCGPAFGAFATASGAAIKLAGAVFSDDGSRETSAEVAGPASEAEQLGRYLAEVVLSRSEDAAPPPPVPCPEAGWPDSSSIITVNIAGMPRA